MPLDGQHGYALLARGTVRLAAGDAAGALPTLRDAGARLRLAAMAVPEALAAGVAAVAAESLGDTATATSLRADAMELARRTGSRLVGAMVEQGRIIPVDQPEPAPREGRTLARLTNREQEIADRIATGATTNAIGRALSISPRTVEAHISRIYRKLEVSSRAALVALVTRRDTD
jgi:DNA-binding NarL/FixJ family response regulator